MGESPSFLCSQEKNEASAYAYNGLSHLFGFSLSDAKYHKEYYYRTHARRLNLKRAAQRARRIELRRKIKEYLQGKYCVDCGEDDLIVLEFDHVKGKKLYCVANMGRSHGWANILKEIKKCAIRCANCHRRKTARDHKWFIAE